jgi:hypothetical protein
MRSWPIPIIRCGRVEDSLACIIISADSLRFLPGLTPLRVWGDAGRDGGFVLARSSGARGRASFTPSPPTFLGSAALRIPVGPPAIPRYIPLVGLGLMSIT